MGAHDMEGVFDPDHHILVNADVDVSDIQQGIRWVSDRYASHRFHALVKGTFELHLSFWLVLVTCCRGIDVAGLGGHGSGADVRWERWSVCVCARKLVLDC